MSSRRGDWLQGIWGASASDVFAAGSGGIQHYDGNTWSFQQLNGGDSLQGVWGSSSSDIFVVSHQGSILHYSFPI
jgi:hypothetical protein